jgi:hypothetical protein
VFHTLRVRRESERVGRGGGERKKMLRRRQRRQRRPAPAALLRFQEGAMQAGRQEAEKK